MGAGLGWEPSIAVMPASPYSFEHDDFADLVRHITIQSDTGLLADRVQVRLGYLYGDAWPPDWTWVTFVLDEAARTAVDAMALGIVAWGRSWIKKKRATDPNAQPIKARILGPDGELLREVEVPADESE
jgi:hypothetical protein